MSVNFKREEFFYAIEIAINTCVSYQKLLLTGPAILWGDNEKFSKLPHISWLVSTRHALYNSSESFGKGRRRSYYIRGDHKFSVTNHPVIKSAQ